jgi:hypothetical protein
MQRPDHPAVPPTVPVRADQCYARNVKRGPFLYRRR